MIKRFCFLLFLSFFSQSFSSELNEIEEKESYRNDKHVFREFSFSFGSEDDLVSLWTGQKYYIERNFPNGYSVDQIFPDLLNVDKGTYIFFYFDSTIAPKRFVVDNVIIAFIPQDRDSVYYYMIPGFPASNNRDVHHVYPDWARCIEKHVLSENDRVRASCKKRKTFSKKIAIPKENALNDVSINLHFINSEYNEYMDLFLCDKGWCRHHLHMDNITALKDEQIEKGPILEKYVNLYKTIRQELDLNFDGCYWSDLIGNLNGFTVKTDFPTGFSDLRRGCPSVKR